MADILLDFISDLDLVASDLSYRNSVGFTYERDDGLARSWIDHIICSQVLSPSMTNVHTLKSGTNLSLYASTSTFNVLQLLLLPSLLNQLPLIGQ